MTTIDNTIETVTVLLAPVGLLYGWFFYWKRVRFEPPGWRKGVTVASLALVSLVILLWPASRVLMPTADWASGVGVGHQVRWVEAWERLAGRTLLAALVLALFGRPRLILPIIVACVGTALFWSLSSMP